MLESIGVGVRKIHVPRAISRAGYLTSLSPGFLSVQDVAQCAGSGCCVGLFLLSQDFGESKSEHSRH